MTRDERLSSLRVASQVVREFVVVRGEEDARLGRAGDEFARHSVRDGVSVERRSSSSELVENDERR